MNIFRGEEFPTHYKFDNIPDDEYLWEGRKIGIALAVLANDPGQLLVWSQGMVIGLSKMKYREKYGKKNKDKT